MANADRCACCGAIIPEGKHYCQNCLVASFADPAKRAAEAFAAAAVSTAKAVAALNKVREIK